MSPATSVLLDIGVVIVHAVKTLTTVQQELSDQRNLQKNNLVGKLVPRTAVGERKSAR